MKRFRSCSLLLLLFLPFLSQAQVNGIVTDNKTGKPLPGVEVFINKTCIGTISDETGRFAIDNVVPGFQEIVLFKKGYDLYRSSMKIQADRSYNLQLSLIANKKKGHTTLTEQEKAQLTNKLLGASPTDLVTLQNVTDIQKIINDGQPILVSSSSLIVQNNQTGYQLNYFLQGLPLEALGEAPIRFDPLVTSDIRQNIAWEQKRKEYFKGSTRHWLMAMTTDHLSEEGYLLTDTNGKKINTQSLLSTSSLPEYFKLTIDHPLTVVYTEDNGMKKTTQVNTNGLLDVNARGELINDRALLLQGDMARVSLVDQLPVDYEPIVGNVEETYASTIERFREKIYVHTDKPYYYPGEPIWFKGYINYREPLWRDSLSRVIYVELIDPKNKITLSKTLKIDSGFFYNDFILPDTLEKGTYYLRAYTSLNRNFGDNNLLVRQIPILNLTDKVVYGMVNGKPESNSFITIRSDKQTYKSRERVTLTLQTGKKAGEPIASNLSISVTDAVQVVPVEPSTTIVRDFSFKPDEQNKILELKYPVEYGVAFNGKFLNDKNKGEKTTLDILQLNPRRMMLAVTDDQGLFTQNGLDFYDSATFSIKSEKAKDHPYGKVELLPREIAKMNFTRNNFEMPVENTASPQRVISEYEVPKTVRLLENVDIKAKRLAEEYQDDYRTRRPYGKPDHVLTAKDLTKYADLNYAIAGKIPGLIVVPAEKLVVFSRALYNSINFGSNPLVTVDDVPLNGAAGDILSMINPATVESIEFTNRINVLYGSRGAAGIIAIYTKKGVSAESLISSPNFQNVKISGYAPSRRFKAPDYAGDEKNNKAIDYRSTIYWNPELKTNPATGQIEVSFFAADLPGNYRIEVEGVLGDGEPVRSVQFIEVDREN